MAKETKKKAQPALSLLEIEKIADQLVALRKKILNTGATVLRPTPEWDKLRKEIAFLNKTLNADTAAKLEASQVTNRPNDPAPPTRPESS